MVKRLLERPRGEQPLSLRLSSENPELFPLRRENYSGPKPSEL